MNYPATGFGPHEWLKNRRHSLRFSAELPLWVSVSEVFAGKRECIQAPLLPFVIDCPIGATSIFGSRFEREVLRLFPFRCRSVLAAIACGLQRIGRNCISCVHLVGMPPVLDHKEARSDCGAS